VACSGSAASLPHAGRLLLELLGRARRVRRHDLVSQRLHGFQRLDLGLAIIGLLLLWHVGVRDEAGLRLFRIVALGALGPAVGHPALSPRVVNVLRQPFDERRKTVGQVSSIGVDRVGLIRHGAYLKGAKRIKRPHVHRGRWCPRSATDGRDRADAARPSGIRRSASGRRPPRLI